MNEDVLEWGPERPRRRFGSVGVGLAALALLAAGIFGATRDKDGKPAAAPSASPTPSRSFSAGWTEYPEVDPTFGPDDFTEPDPFEQSATYPKPAPGAAVAVLLPNGTPVYLVNAESEVVALVPFGGVSGQSVLVGWCPRTSTFQDPAGAHRYDLRGRPNDHSTPPLGHLTVRQTPGDADKVDVAITDDAFGGGYFGYFGDNTPTPVPTCKPGEVRLPKLPARATKVQDTSRAMRLVHGRYVVSIETRAFCEISRTTGCAAGGWEEMSPFNALLPSSLVESYTYEGDFLVRTYAQSGSVTAVRVDAKVVSTAGVGVKAVRAQAKETYVSNGVTRLKAEQRSGKIGGARIVSDYVLSKDLHAFLTHGVTGLGKPPGTRQVFVDWVADEPEELVWLVLDSHSQVIRVVVDNGLVDVEGEM
ncbi:MAG: hypothetical protein QOE05_838 [Actinomycetota bacterium]|nr:hypothetical protein [Actinomycetota bacterium]